jgi:hypothetical protein
MGLRHHKSTDKMLLPLFLNIRRFGSETEVVCIHATFVRNNDDNLTGGKRSVNYTKRQFKGTRTKWIQLRIRYILSGDF